MTQKLRKQVGPNWSQASHTPPHPKEQLQLAIDSGNSKDQRSALERIAGPCPPCLPAQISHTPPPRLVEQMQLSNNSGNSKERRSALDCLSEPRLPVQARLGGTSSLESARLQEVEVQYLGDEDQEILARRLSQPTNVTHVTHVNTELAEEDPIISRSETMSEDLAPRRIHPSLTIGVQVSSPPNASPSNGKRKAPGAESTSKATGKHKIIKQARRVPRSPLGVNLRKVNAVRAHNPPRKKLCLEKDKGGPSNVDFALTAEALEVRKAVLEAYISNAESLVVLSDSQVLIRILQTKSPRKEFNNILVDIHH
ncbi:hypothetical protein DY000_02034254 [Brassica cretica]|uniref:CRIB domain-containing protein n=1 Tax=Brassica cretica TaxID=69181 RepID=A0ABQ7DXG6_BRACR|nr:hypothetical protein DY000_02034254 [Brassica cretica]